MRVVLETARLLLREIEPTDLDFLAAMLGDPEVMRYYPKPLERAESAAWLDRQRERYARDGHGLWLVLHRRSGEPLGQVGVLEQDLGDDVETEIGYLIAQAHWRQGFASEAARACRDWAFSALGRKHLVSLIRPENLPSQGVARSNGMALERTIAWRGLTHHVFGVSRGEAPTPPAKELPPSFFPDLDGSGSFLLPVKPARPFPQWARGPLLSPVSVTSSRKSPPP